MEFVTKPSQSIFLGEKKSEILFDYIDLCFFDINTLYSDMCVC